MKKNLIILSLILFLILNVSLIKINAQQIPQIPGLSGTTDESTGLPSEFVKFQEIADKLSEEESRKEYLKQEWTKILANNKVFGPVLFYTNKSFSFFNPFWKIIFGIEFGWSWKFILSFFIWLFIVILVYSPVKELTKFNPILSFLGAVLVASLCGYLQFIQIIVSLLIIILKNIWLVLLAILIMIVVAYIYNKIFKDIGKKLKKKQEDFLEKRNRALLDKRVKQLEGLSKVLK
jgi:c-di-AMP phosphodiesterase-like protein